MGFKIFLTVDCEDFINDRSLFALYHVLKLLHKYNLKGLFFLTGHMAEKISCFPKLLDLFEDEDIGYHSSAHSVRPIIIEYTDVKNYALASKISLERETKHISPTTGESDGKGGISFLRNLFPNKRILSFRAPGFSFSPPHVEALRELGIRFDFSADLSSTPIEYKNLTFYPYPILINGISRSSCKSILKHLTQFQFGVFVFHPNYFVNAEYWDSVYFYGNPKKLHSVPPRSWKETKSILRRFELLLRWLSQLENRGIFEITPSLKRGEKKDTFTMDCVLKGYQKGIVWAKRYFGYRPRFILNHYMEFFDLPCEQSEICSVHNC